MQNLDKCMIQSELAGTDGAQFEMLHMGMKGDSEWLGTLIYEVVQSCLKSSGLNTA